MMSLSVGDMAQQFMFRRKIGETKASSMTLSRELASGLVADTSRRVNGNVTELAGIRAVHARASAQSDIARSAGVLLAVQQSTVETMRDAVQLSLDDMILLNTNSQDPGFSRSLGLMEHRFRDTVSMLNTSFAGRSVFGGVSQESKAISDADFLLDSLRADMAATLPPNAGAHDISTFVDDWFREATPPDVSAFDTVGYLGGARIPARLDLGDGHDVGLEITAQASAFRKTLAAFAKGAVLSQALFEKGSAQKDAAVSVLRDELGSANAGLIALSVQIGTEEARASRGVAHAEAQKSGMHEALVALLEADPYETAARLEETISRLELLFTLTSRLSRLTLNGFLR